MRKKFSGGGSAGHWCRQLYVKMAPEVPSEEILGRKWDRCLADTTLKIGMKSCLFHIHVTHMRFSIPYFVLAGTGAIVGGVFSLIFFKSKCFLQYCLSMLVILGQCGWKISLLLLIFCESWC